MRKESNYISMHCYSTIIAKHDLEKQCNIIVTESRIQMYNLRSLK